MSYRKTAYEKFLTKLNSLKEYQDVELKRNTIHVNNKVLAKFSEQEIKYGKSRYSAGSIIPIYEDDFEVIVTLNHENLSLINSKPVNPPRKVRNIVRIFYDVTGNSYEKVYLGSNVNKIVNKSIHLTKELYLTLLQIDSEEGKDKKIRVRNRAIPFLKSNYGINNSVCNIERNYSLLLKEVLESGEFTQQDIITFSEQLENGEASKIIIEKQISKQTEWLIETFDKILEYDNINIPTSKKLGKENFGYSKISVTGAEHLMEKILADYGQYSIFGVPALINTNKYVIHEGSSRSQFDLILINHLGDIEIVELKRPDKYLLEYGNGRGKFYPSKDLAIAISQTERYITAIYKDNDEEYKIDGKKIRDFVNEQVGNTIYFESIRPKGLIIMGSWKKLSIEYENLDIKIRNKLTKDEYESDCMQAYKEIKNSLKNISILTYSELLENARTRLELNKEE